MGLQDIIQCAPWRLPAPRPLSAYEWTVVENTLQDAIVFARGGLYSVTTRAMAVALTQAIRGQGTCPSWTHSAFGPEPAVPLFSYGCLGSWWGALDPASQARALVDISSAGLLCSESPPWSSCPRATGDRSWRPETQNEYSVQKGAPVAPGVIVPGCIFARRQTGYVATTGQGAVVMLQAIGGGPLSPQLQQMVAQGGALFANRSFLLGFEFRAIDWSKMPGGTGGMADLQGIANGMLEDAALIWAPGQGVSIRSALVTGQMDPAAMLALMQAMLPGAIDEILKGLPGIISQQLPGLLPPPETWGTILGGLFGQVGQQSTGGLVSDPEMPRTGLTVVDKPGTQQDSSPPGSATTTIATAKGPDNSTLLAIGAIILGAVMIWRGRTT